MKLQARGSKSRLAQKSVGLDESTTVCVTYN